MAQKYTTISKDGIQYLCGLINQLANISEGIDDLNLRSDGTFSSVKIDTLLNTLKTDCNEYTDRLVANLSRLELKIANAESEITQPNTMYLYKPAGATSYEQYVVIEGTKVLLGTCDIDMGNYYTKAQADAKFVLKTDFDSLKTKVDEKVDKTSIITAKDNNATDDQVYSAKAVNTLLNNKVDKMVMLKSQNVDDLVNEGSYYVIEAINAPDAYGWIDVLANNDYTIQLFYPSITTNCEMYIRRRQNGVWSSGWQRVCTTSVADVVNKITDVSTLGISEISEGLIIVTVKNGWCQVIIQGLIINSTFSNIINIPASLPKPVYQYNWVAIFDYNSSNASSGSNTNITFVKPTDNGALMVDFVTAKAGNYFTTFSYPVAEE